MTGSDQVRSSTLLPRKALKRRNFLKASGAAVAMTGLPLFHLQAKIASRPNSSRQAANKLKSWEDLYRQRWTWDSITRGSHGWVNCRSACNWDLYVKDGVVVREEQSANYEASEEGVPDFNPRGCQKGACYTEVMYGPTRLTVPMKRAGERGEGKWERISWDQALTEIAEKLINISKEHGGETIVQDLGPHFDLGATNAARNRFFGMIGAALPDDWAEIGDLNIGATMTLGMPHIGGSSDEWFLSDFLVVWMMNPSVTQMPDAHFLFEAKYNGAELVVIDPIYSATAIHADTWLPLKPGMDAVLGLATARHIWESGNIDLPYVREQTDFPVLVRLDTGRFLREVDLKGTGSNDLVYLWDPSLDQPYPAPGCEGAEGEEKIDLNGFEPPIEGQFDVVLHDGTEVQVTTVGSLVREQLAPYTLENAAELTGLSVELVEKFADGFAKAERPMVLSSWGSNRYLHSDQMNRTKLLCLSLKGAIGKRGAGYHSTGWIGIDGFSAASSGDGSTWGAIKGMVRMFGNTESFGMLIDKIAGNKSDALFQHQIMKFATSTMNDCLTNSASQNYNHQGLKEDMDREMDPLYPRPFEDYVAEAQEKKWMPVRPGAKKKPRAWISGGSNVLRRSNLPQRMLDTMWPDLELVVDINQKVTFTGLNADYLLPAAGYYEKPGIKYSVAYIPYTHYCGQAVKPVGEAKDEWELFSLLSAKVQEIAKRENIPPLAGACDGGTIDLKTINERFSFYGKYGPMDAEQVNSFIIENSPSLEGHTVEELKKNGIGKYANIGGQGIQESIFNSEWKGEGVLTSLTDMSVQKWRWPTLTGRQQYYIDHPWFIEAGEALPTHIESPKAGGDYPFQFISCHSRWSIHSVWRDTGMLLNMQRGEPTVYLNPEDARELGIEDNAWASLSNDYGKMRMRTKISTMVRPKVAYYFHAWEPHQFPDHKSYKWLIPGLMNPLHFAGGQRQIGWYFGHYEPGQHVQDTRIAIEPWHDDAVVEGGQA